MRAVDRFAAPRTKSALMSRLLPETLRLLQSELCHAQAQAILGMMLLKF